MTQLTASNKRLIHAFKKLSTTNVSDALDSIGLLRNAAVGVLPMWDCPKIVGPAVTLKIAAAGMTPSKGHLGNEAIDVAKPGDVIVIDNGGRIDESCWGGILAFGAKKKGIAGIVIDGAHRDLDDIKKVRLPVFAKGVVPCTARGRIMQDATNTLIRCGNAQVRPGDIIMGDDNGVVVIPLEKAEDVLKAATEMFQKENTMIKEIATGGSMQKVDKKFKYEQMTQKKN